MLWYNESKPTKILPVETMLISYYWTCSVGSVWKRGIHVNMKEMSHKYFTVKSTFIIVFINKLSYKHLKALCYNITYQIKSSLDYTSTILYHWSDIPLHCTKKNYCPTVFLEISLLFDRVWYAGFLFKLKKFFLVPYFILIKSNFFNHSFTVCLKNSYSIKAGIF